MSKPRHTPLPWSAQFNIYGEPPKYEGDRCANLEPVANSVGCLTNEDAEFIVRAVNSHYDLLAACESLLKIAEAAGTDFGAYLLTGERGLAASRSQAERMESWRAAIAKAKP